MPPRHAPDFQRIPRWVFIIGCLRSPTVLRRFRWDSDVITVRDYGQCPGPMMPLLYISSVFARSTNIFRVASFPLRPEISAGEYESNRARGSQMQPVHRSDLRHAGSSVLRQCTAAPECSMHCLWSVHLLPRNRSGRCEECRVGTVWQQRPGIVVRCRTIYGMGFPVTMRERAIIITYWQCVRSGSSKSLCNSAFRCRYFYRIRSLYNWSARLR